jgi:hypothetical protein
MTQKTVSCVSERDGGNAELVGLLTAISVVSGRLAGRIASLERRQTEKPKGGKAYGTNERVVRCRGRD